MALIDVLPSYRVNLSLSQFLSIATGEIASYGFLGRVVPWENEIDPPDPAGFSTKDFTETRLNIVAARRLLAGINVIPAIRRVTWVSGTTYAYYDDTPSADGVDLFSKDFYVYTSERHIFKCIWNNFDGKSTVMPTVNINPTEIFTTSDGYRWKYMHTVSETDTVIFKAKQSIPIRAFSEGFPIGGVLTGLVGDMNENIAGGADTFLPLTIIGTGTGAIGFVVIRKGRIVNTSFVNPGANYDNTTVAQFTDPLSGKIYFLKVLVNEFNLRLPLVAGSALQRSSGIEHVIIQNRGAFYDTGATVQILGDGTGATATAVLRESIVLSDITIVDSGEGIQSADLLIESTSGKNAVAKISSIQDGKILGITISNYGEDFTNDLTSTKITLTNIVGVAGVSLKLPRLQPKFTLTKILDRIDIVTPGFGYRQVTVNVIGNSVDGRFASGRAIINPLSGHGGNVLTELFANQLILAANFEFEGDFDGTIGDFPVNNDVRQVGILANPLNKSGIPATAFSLNACYNFKILNSSNMEQDSIWTTPDNPRIQLRLVSVREDFNGDKYAFFNSIGFDDPIINTNDPSFTDTIVLQTNPSIVKTVTSIIEPELDAFSGNLIYLANRSPYTRSDTQLELVSGVIRY